VILKVFRFAAHYEKKSAAHFLQNKVALKKLIRWVCLFSGTNKDRKEVPFLPTTPAFSHQFQEVSRFLLLISVRAENPY